MPSLVLDTPDALKNYVGKEVVVTGWMTVTQKRIQQFAEATDDRQWIHTDSERAARESPYKTTIAHGFLTLSLLSQFIMQALQVQGVRMGINYGLNKVRFPSAVPVGSKIRARFTLQTLEEITGSWQAVWNVVMEREGGGKPCCVAQWLVRYYT